MVGGGEGTRFCLDLQSILGGSLNYSCGLKLKCLHEVAEKTYKNLSSKKNGKTCTWKQCCVL